MKIFSERLDKEMTDVVPHSDAFKEIKPQRMTYAMAEEYLKNMLDSLHQENLREKMFDYSPEDLNLDFEFTDKIMDVLNEFQPENWEQLEIDEKKEAVEQLVGLIGEGLGMEDSTVVSYFEDSPEHCGWYNEMYREIAINENTFDDPKEVMDTVAHEMKHAYQRYRADMAENDLDKLYKFNFDHYVTPVTDENGHDINFMEYQDQFVEAEARAFAEIFTEKVNF